MAEDKKSQSDDARLGGKRKATALPATGKKREKSHSLANMAFNICILAFIGYGFYSYMQKGGNAGVFNELGERLDVIDAPIEGDPYIDRLEQQSRLSVLDKLTPVKTVAVNHQTLEKGQGAPAMCGQTARYKIITGAGSQQQVSDIKTIQLGDVKKPHGLTLAIEGMRVGEVRKASIPQELWTGIAREERSAVMTQLTLELVSIDSSIPENALGLRRFVSKSGSGLPLRCGDLAMVHVAIWAENGQKLFSTEKDKPVYFYLGENHVPYALQRGVQDMLPGGQYSLVFSPDLWKNLAENNQSSPMPPYEVQPFPQELALPDGQLIMIDVAYPREVARKNLPANNPPVTEPVTPPLNVGEPPELTEPMGEVNDPMVKMPAE